MSELAYDADRKSLGEVRVETAADMKAETWDAVRADAIEAEAAEHTLSVRESLRQYPMAVFWSFAMSLVIIMEGYDTALLGNVTALETYRHKFGSYTPEHGWQLSAAWQTAVGQAAVIGNTV